MRTLKDSGIPWLGQIPEQWNICSFKRLVCIYNGSDYVQVQVDEGGFPVVGSGGEFARANSFLYDGEAIFIGRKGTIDKPFYLKGKFWAIDTVFYCVPQSIANGKYYYYQAMNFPYGRYITSTTRPSLTQTDLGNNLVILPPLPEQERIAEYLDEKCAEIDELISVEERMIAELQAYKQSVITETVTRGLNPDAPLKDSGIPWLGQIPEHWNICSFKRLVCIYNGSDYVQVQVDEGGFPVVGSGGEFARSNSFLYDGEAIFIGRKGTIDKPFYLKGKFWAIDTVFYCVPQSIANGKYYYYQAMNFPYGRYITSTTRPSLTQTDLGNNLVILPPLPEQKAIAKYLDRKCAEIDALVEVKQRKIEELKEYKKSVIYEYVTGKREVS